jgi:hypothetical protein
MNHQQSANARDERARIDGTFDEPRCHIPLRHVDAARSAANIMKWNSYLPAPCVRAMVRMGWDYTT